jgi:hypothetical protein
MAELVWVGGHFKIYELSVAHHNYRCTMGKFCLFNFLSKSKTYVSIFTFEFDTLKNQ